MISITHSGSPGVVFRWPKAYDWLLRLVWGRDEQNYRHSVLELATIGEGLSVLDIGGGTGTLAIAARTRVGPNGRVSAVDASSEMIERARAKSRAAGLTVEFVEATAQSLPFESESFDRVLSTTVIHCLPKDDRKRSFMEMARVLKPGGRLLLVDFGGSAKSSFFGHLSAHSAFDLLRERSSVVQTGLVEVASGPLGFSDLHYILAAKQPWEARSARPAEAQQAPEHPRDASRK